MSDADRIVELEKELALKNLELAGVGSMLLDVQQDCINLRKSSYPALQQRVAIASLGHWGRTCDVADLEALQVDLAYERLMRSRYGEVGTLSTTFFSTSEAAPIEELIAGLAEATSCKYVGRARESGRYSLVTFIGDDVACHLAKPYREPDLRHLFIATPEPKVIDGVLAVFEALGYTIGSKADIDGIVPVTFVMPTSDGITTSHREFKSLPLDSVKQNYTQEVMDATQRAIQAMREASSGVLIISGEPGTGKSYLIRAILSELKERHAIVCTPPAQFLTQMDKLAQAASSSDSGPAVEGGSPKGSVMVMEDIGDLLAQDNVTHHLNETSNFLNLTDGLLSLLTDIVFIVSFNHDIAAINPALTRPGRCLGQIKVDKLPAEQVRELVGFGTYGACTLAEVYEMRRTGKAIKPAVASRLPGGAR